MNMNRQHIIYRQGQGRKEKTLPIRFSPEKLHRLFIELWRHPKGNKPDVQAILVDLMRVCGGDQKLRPTQGLIYRWLSGEPIGSAYLPYVVRMIQAKKPTHRMEDHFVEIRDLPA